VVLPTGTGKTVVFAELARRRVARGRRVLVLAHRGELLEQAQRKLSDVGVRAAIEQADRRAGLAPVVVASVQTLQRKRLERLVAEEFDVIVDEAHHAIAASYGAILDHFAASLVLGVTATPLRADGRGLGEIFGSVAHRYELQQAIRDGWLVPIVARRIFVASIDLGGIKTRAGDLATDELAAAMATDEAILAVVLPVLEQAGSRRTIVFAVDVAHARALAVAICERRPGAARVAHGELDDAERRQILADFRAGVFQYLVNVQLYTEGFDEPSVECVVCARPTKSWALYTQMVGRGTRLSPATGKRDLLLLDVAGNSGRHRLVGPIDALAAGEAVDDLVRGEAERMLEEGEQDLDGLVAEAAAELERRREAARRTANASYFARDVDPFFGDQLGEPCTEVWAGDLATQQDHVDLLNLGLKRIPPGLTRGEAKRILDADRKRRGLGLCTYKQCQLLERYGINAREMTKVAASARIGILAQCEFDPARAKPRLQMLEAAELLAAAKGRP
jgi:superfamily II DNA or RNA helicase